MIPSVSGAGRAGNGLGLYLSIATLLALGAAQDMTRLPTIGRWSTATAPTWRPMTPICGNA